MSFSSRCKAAMLVVMVCVGGLLNAQDTTITSVDVNLENIFSQRYPREYLIASVSVSGNKYFDSTLLLSVAGLNVGDRISIPGGDDFSRAINKLWAQNYFSNVSIYINRLEKPNLLHLEIEVQERPRLQHFTFTGVKKNDKDELTTKTGLISGRIITENNKQLAKDAVVKYFEEKGYRNVQVKVVEVPSTTVPNSTDLVFEIDRGPKIRISDIYVGGNHYVTDQKVKRKMKGTKEMSRLSLFAHRDSTVMITADTFTVEQVLGAQGFLQPSVLRDKLDPYVRIRFGNAKFNSKKYLEDKEKVLDYFNAQGYRDARILKDTIYQNSTGNLNIEMQVTEGKQYYFGNMVFRGNTRYTDSLLLAIMDIKKGDVYNIETLNKALGKQMSADATGADISALYMDDGYLFFRAEANETAVYNDTIDHEIRLFEGPQATIKNINISGNDKTKDYVIRRELRTLPGEKFSRTDLIRSQREIANLNFFNQETIGINPVPDQTDGTVDINYSVEEKSSDQLELSAGWGGGIGLTGTLGVTFNNFSIKNILRKETWDPLPSGDGQKLSVRVQSNGRAFRSYNFSFTEPWLGGKKRNSFSVSVYDTKFSNAYNPLTGTYERNPSSYIKTTGATVGLGKQLKWPDDFFTLSTSLSYNRYVLKDYQFFEDFRNGTSNVLALKLALQRSSVDNPLFPRGGSNFLMSLALTPPWSIIQDQKEFYTAAERYKNIEYWKWRFNGEWYVPLSKAHGEERNKQFVLKLAAKYGFIGRYNKDLPISPFERFQVGDAGMSNQFAMIGFDIIAHRGYPVYQTSNPKINPDQQGASRYFTIFNKYIAEVRYPLSLNPSSTIFALGFFEAANGWYDFKDYNPFKLRRSVGLGMRFFLPMFGLLGFDYGIGLDRITPGGGFKNAGKFTFMLGFEPE